MNQNEVSEIMKSKDHCIQEESPYCNTACPVHVNVRSLMQGIRQGNYDQVYKMYAKKVLFPGIISRICDEPCKNSCIRDKLDAPLSIRLLEKAVIDYRNSNNSESYATLKKNQSVCIVGGGLSGMSCALDLARKGYSVTLYEKSDRLGGRLQHVDPLILPPEILNGEIYRLEAEEVEICLNTQVEHIASLKFDACFIATGGESGEFNGLIPAYESCPEYRTTFESVKKGIFIVPDAEDKYSSIVAVLQGMQASRSIERYLKNTSLYSGRENELSTDTCLYTDVSEGSITRAVIPFNLSAGYTKEEAMEEASRCLLCECLECNKKCMYLRNYKGYPKTYISAFTGMYYTPKGLGTKKYMHQLNSCSLCGLCKEVCPVNLDMGQINDELKKIFCHNGSMPAGFHDFWLRDMEFSSGDDYFMVKGQPHLSESEYMFFPGCQLGASDPSYVLNTYRYLTEKIKGGVGLYLGCCGAPADWSGRNDILDKTIQTLRENWENQGKPQFILACPTCHKIFQKYLADVPVLSLWEMFSEYGIPDGYTKGNGTVIALYDPCSSRYLPQVQKSVRDLLKNMGYVIEELKMNGRYAQCCSYGGLISTVNPKLAQEIRDQRVNASPRDYVTYCTNCRDDFAGNGKLTWHLLDIIFGDGSAGNTLKIPPTRSQRIKNRKTVKADMLETYWGEKMESPELEYETINLILPDDIIKAMDDRFILMNEIKQVIYHAEKNGSKFFDKENGHYSAHMKIGSVTYWAEYLKHDDNSYTIFKTYSHRVQIMEECDCNES